MKEEYLKYILAFKNLNIEDKKNEIIAQLAELINFINTTNQRLGNNSQSLSVLTEANTEEEYLNQLFTIILSLKEENGKLVNYLIDNNII